MKALFLVLAALTMIVLPIFGNGVLLTGEYNNQYYQLLNSEILVDVEDQVAVITSSQEFLNNQGENNPKYVFPLPEGASATQLRWFYNQKWYVASFAPVEQDSLPPNPGNGWPDQLQTYMGESPLFYNFDNPVAANQHILVELTYVMLLPYSNGNVTFEYRNNYNLIQNTPLANITLDFQLSSQRTIMDVDLIGLNGSVTNTGHTATVSYATSNQANIPNFKVVYALDPEEFGLFSLSTKLTEVPDAHPEGFFLFIAEPDPSDNQVVIDKTFTLIMDRSGSMWGTKMTQAKNAANYIIDHLNDGDMFNIVSFATDVTSFWPQHVTASAANRNAAHNYVNAMAATGGTNISGAFDVAVPQFNNANPNNASIIIFLTDGEATAGITSTPLLRQHVANLFDASELTINLFNFGIGANLSQQLLTLLAMDHNGIAMFLGDQDFEPFITQFYNIIANPVLINPTMNIGALAGITEVYPDPLPNAYQGSQMLVAGRYANGGLVDLELNGQTYNGTVTYDYSMNLADSLITGKQFLTKIWAKLKIEHLMGLYYSFPEGSAQANDYKQQIIDISLAYGVISPFTSFSSGDPGDPGDPGGGGGGGIDINDEAAPPIAAYILKGNFPNPFNPSTAIRFAVNKDAYKMVKVRIYNLRGQVIKVLALTVNGKGDYEVVWDGTDMKGSLMPSAVYFYVIDFGEAQLSGRMVMSK